MGKRRVVVTGTSDYITNRILPVLHERYDLTLLDVKTTNREDEEVESIHVTDLLDRDRNTYREFFQGADAVVHSKFTRASKPEDRY